MGVDTKSLAIRGLGADIVVIPECRSDPRLASESDVSFAWKGTSLRKGLGVFGFGAWRVEPLTPRSELPWVLPLEVHSPAGARVALLLAVWTVAGRPGAPRPSYSGQLAEAIAAWEPELRDGATILAGDVNCSLQAAVPRRHPPTLERLEAMGVRSAYHAHNRVVHGSETAPTLRWIGPGKVARGYHCDYVLLSRALAGRVVDATVGAHAAWIQSGLSDHAPVVVDLDLGGLDGWTR